MQKMTTLESWGTLTCGEVQTAVRYKLTVSAEKVAGTLSDVDPAVAFMASQVDVCRLVLEGGRELDVRATRLSDGTVEVISSGPIPDF